MCFSLPLLFPVPATTTFITIVYVTAAGASAANIVDVTINAVIPILCQCVSLFTLLFTISATTATTTFITTVSVTAGGGTSDANTVAITIIAVTPILRQCVSLFILLFIIPTATTTTIATVTTTRLSAYIDGLGTNFPHQGLEG